MNIEVGEYIRTKYGYIAKIESIDNDIICCDSVIDFDYEESWVLLKDSFGDIIKHSFEIVDLIEKGDYVNGELIREISPNGKVLFYLDYDKDKMIENGDIERVLTKEQFNRGEYRINE